MPDYRRIYRPGGLYFFTVVTEARAPLFGAVSARALLSQVIRECMASRPFEMVAIVLLLDHLHTIWKLPECDTDYSTRWAFIKSNFTRRWLESGGTEQRRTGSRVAHRRRGVWQRRFWEHLIADEKDYERHLNYLHFNPVKHGLVTCPHAWEFGTFDKWTRRGVYEGTWMCACAGQLVTTDDFGLDGRLIELEWGRVGDLSRVRFSGPVIRCRAGKKQ